MNRDSGRLPVRRHFRFGLTNQIIALVEVTPDLAMTGVCSEPLPEPGRQRPVAGLFGQFQQPVCRLIEDAIRITHHRQGVLARHKPKPCTPYRRLPERRMLAHAL